MSSAFGRSQQLVTILHAALAHLPHGLTVPAGNLANRRPKRKRRHGSIRAAASAMKGPHVSGRSNSESRAARIPSISAKAISASNPPNSAISRLSMRLLRSLFDAQPSGAGPWPASPQPKHPKSVLRPQLRSAIIHESRSQPPPPGLHFILQAPAHSLLQSGNLLIQLYVFKSDSVSIPAQIARALHRNKRLFVLLLLAATLFAQSAALVSESRPHHATEHCCLLCHVSLPFVQTKAPVTVAPLTGVQWLTSALRVESFYDVFLSATSSRGPPAHS